MDGNDDTQETTLDDALLGAVWLHFGPPGANEPLAVPLRPGAAIVVGSDIGASVQLPDARVSARHCRIEHVGARLEVTDLGSRNGVHLGGARVAQARLGIGAAFEVGRTTVRVEPRAATGSEEGAILPGLLGRSRAMRCLAASTRRIAPLRLPALIRGESGTGKDLVARALHSESPRADGPFVAINAGAISRELAESELFGHERGAFTGALRARRGAFREADGGTLFLDEIAALPLDLQTKLLRAVEDGRVRPVGAEASLRANVRLVAATCEPLEAMVADRRFRRDLYERLAVCVLVVPPLRERQDDIAEIARHMLETSDLPGGRSHAARSRSSARSLPGNVRELRNVVIQAAVHSQGMIEAEHVAAVVSQRNGSARRRLTPIEARRIFEQVGCNVSAAARYAELPRSTMRDLLRQVEAPRAVSRALPAVESLGSWSGG